MNSLSSRRRARVTVLVLLVGLVAMGANAQDSADNEYLVEYVEGFAEVRQEGVWYEIAIADVLTAADEIRLYEGAYLEIAGDGTRLKITRPGSYDVAEIAAQSRRREQAQTRSLLSNRIGRFSQELPRTDPTVGGARASEAATAEEPAWVGGESVPELIAEGVTMLEEGDYEEAFYLFDEAAYYAYEEEKARADFYRGYAASLLGDTQVALASLEAQEPDPETDYYDTHVLTLADIYVQTFSYEKADELLDGYLGGSVEDTESAQIANLLQGLSLQGMGNAADARRAFETAVEIDPDSRAGAVAEDLAREL